MEEVCQRHLPNTRTKVGATPDDGREGFDLD